jgi:hypothetical protein
VKAALKVTTTGKSGIGVFTATCAGARSVAGTAQAAPVRGTYTVVYGFGGYAAPAAKSVLKKSASPVARALDHLVTPWRLDVRA